MSCRVVVASTNPVKRRAAVEAVRAALDAEDVDVVAVDVPSGVPDQPVGDEETLRGARNRVERARAVHADADLWVAFEGGVAERDGWLEAMAWVVAAGRAAPDGSRSLGESRTATFPLPREIADLVRRGVELGEATDRVLGGHGSKWAGGTVGPLTGGAIDRVAYYAHALVLALVPFRNACLTFPPAPAPDEGRSRGPR